mgnify:CR=1 FL=1
MPPRPGGGWRDGRCGARLQRAVRGQQLSQLTGGRGALAPQLGELGGQMLGIGAFGRIGRYAGQFIFLHALAVDSKGDLYTAEVGTGRRVQKFVRK